MSEPNHSLRTIFAQALEITNAQERDAYLSKICGTNLQLRREVEELIQAECQSGSFLPERPGVGEVGAALIGAAVAFGADGGILPQSPPAEKPGERIGRYKLLENIGEGGMGTVYMAEQEEPVRRRVALKVIKLGMDTKSVIARFEAERQALALMEHPNIAKVFDAGATDAGSPYFVMELVRGIPITDYCDQNHLSTQERLTLFIQICQAIQHAHQKGIIHRDIKPSNILVAFNDGAPMPKIIDFGIAKATSNQRLTDKTLFTALEQFLGTPAYMSPEQAELSGLDIDTRSDIYSLGVLLYELLTGKTPFDAEELLQAGLDEMRRKIREEEPRKPSTRLSTMEMEDTVDVTNRFKMSPGRLAALVRGDLDWIVMKALEKDRSRRYETANGLGMDIRRHLNDEPVMAGPPSTQYRMKKFVRKHRHAVVGAVALAGILAVALVVSSLLAVWARQERTQARLQWQRAENLGKAESQQRQIAERNAREEALQRRRAEEGLSQLKMQQARDLFEANNATKALALLARMLRENPNDHVAAVRLMSALTQRNWPLPAMEPFKHRGDVLWAQFSPDGRSAVTASADNTAQVWDTSTGQAIGSACQHQRGVHFACFSPDGRRVLTCSGDKTARIWNAQTGKPLTPPLDHTALVKWGQFSSNGNLLLTLEELKTKIRIWDAVTGRLISDAITHAHGIIGYAEFSPDGERVVTASSDCTAIIWDARTGNKLAGPLQHRKGPFYQGIYRASFSPDGTRIVTASADGTARVWDAVAGRPLTEPLSHDGVVLSARFSPDGTRVMTISDRTVRLWNARTGQRLGQPISFATEAEFSPDGQRLLTFADSGAQVWDAGTGRALTEPMNHESDVCSAHFSPDGIRVLTASRDHTAQLWDVRSGNLLGQPSTFQGRPILIHFAQDGKQLVLTVSNQTLSVWRAQEGRLVSGPLTHADEVEEAALSSDSSRIMTRCRNSVYLWDFSTGRMVFPPLKHGAAVNSMKLSPDGRLLVTASDDKTAQIWDLEKGEAAVGPLQHTDVVFSAEFSNDGRRVVTFSNDGTICIWNALTGQRLFQPLVHGKHFMASHGRPTPLPPILLSPEGYSVAMVGRDNEVNVWDLRTGKLLSLPLKQEGPVLLVRSNTEGNRLAVASGASVRLWNLDNGQAFTDRLSHRGQVQSAQFDVSGSHVMTTSWDNSIRLWDARTGVPLTEPFLHIALPMGARLSLDNRWLGIILDQHTVQFWELPTVCLPTADWIPELAETVCRRRLSVQRIFEPVQPSAFFQLRTRILASTSSDSDLYWGKWVLADRSTRPISPSAHLDVAQYVGDWIRKNSWVSLEEAFHLVPTNGLALASLAHQVLKRDLDLDSQEFAEAEWAVRHAMELSPNDSEVLRIAAEVAHLKKNSR